MTVFDSGWLKLLDMSGPTAFACFGASAGISYGQTNDWLALKSLPEWAIAASNVGVFFFGALTLVWLCRLILGAIKHATAKLESNRRINEHLDALSDDERWIFTYLLQRGQSAFTCRISDGPTGMLVQRGLVVRPVGQHSILEYPHYVPSRVWKIVRKRQSEFL